jgi:Tfp pilus assembly protein PilF
LLHARLATQAHNAKLHDLAGFIQTLPDPDRLLVACTAVGIPRYFTGAGVLDMVGLTDEVIARDPHPLPGLRDTHFLGHYNVRYVMDRVPDLIYFVTGERPVLQAEKALFLSRRFRQEYYLTYIADDRPIYVRRVRVPSGAEEFAPSGEFIELYSQALDRSPAEEARDLFRLSISKAPSDFAYGHAWLGREYYEAGMIAPATTLFEQALAIDADVVMALAHLAVLRETSDRPSEAVDLARRAVLLAPRSHFCRYVHGRALLAVDRIEEGVAALYEALRLSDTAPSAADAGFRLGLVMYGRGDKDRARQIWQAVLRTDPSHPGARQGLRLLSGNRP